VFLAQVWSLGLSWDLGWWYEFVHCVVLGKCGTLVKEWALLAKPLVSYGQSKHWSKIYKQLTSIWALIGPDWVHWADCGVESDFGLFGPQIGAQLGSQIPAAGSQGFGWGFSYRSDPERSFGSAAKGVRAGMGLASSYLGPGRSYFHAHVHRAVVQTICVGQPRPWRGSQACTMRMLDFAACFAALRGNACVITRMHSI